MKFYAEEEMIVELKDIHQKVIQNDIPTEIFNQDMKRRVHYILTHKYERCLERLKKEWLPRLKERMSEIPTDDEMLATLILSQPDYKNRSQREEESNVLNKEK